MKPAYIPDTVIYGVTDKIPNIKFKKSMKKQKVFVLVTTSSCDYETGSNVEVFANKAKAQKAMKDKFEAERDDFISTYEDESWVDSYISEDSASVSESGDYTRNHIDWEIIETEVL